MYATSRDNIASGDKTPTRQNVMLYSDSSVYHERIMLKNVFGHVFYIGDAIFQNTALVDFYHRSAKRTRVVLISLS